MTGVLVVAAPPRANHTLLRTTTEAVFRTLITRLNPLVYEAIAAAGDDTGRRAPITLILVTIIAAFSRPFEAITASMLNHRCRGGRDRS